MNYQEKAVYPTAAVGGLMVQRQTLRNRLEERQKDIKELLAEVEKALKFMDENPNFEAFHDIIGKVGF